MSRFGRILSEDLHAHPAVVAWRELAPASALPDRVVVLKRKEKGAVYRLIGLAPGGGAIIAKRASREKAAIERTVYERVLPKLPVPALCCHGFVEEADGRFAWLFLEDVGAECYAPDDPEHRRLAARWLALFHTWAAAADLRAAFPDRGVDHHRRYLRAIGEELPRFRSLPALGPDGIAVLGRIGDLCERIESRWPAVAALCEAAPATLVHADCLAKNVHFRSGAAGRSVAPFDWGGAGWGVAASDLGQLALPRRGPPDDEPDCAAYLEVAGQHWSGLDLESVRQLANVGQLFWALKVTSRGLPELACDWARPEDVVLNLAIYAEALARSLRLLRADAGSARSERSRRPRPGAPGAASHAGEMGDRLLREALSAWRSLAAGLGEPRRVEVLKRDASGTAVYRLDLGEDGCVVAKRSPRATSDVERAVYEEILPKIPVASPRYHGSAVAAGGDFGWLFVEEARGRTLRPERESHRVAAARWLASLHLGTAGLLRVPALPARRPDHYRKLLAGTVAALRRRLDVEQDCGARAVLGDVLAQLDAVAASWGGLERACEGVRDTLVHGDLVDHNVHVRDEPAGLVLLPFDWEKAGWGPPAEDLASVDLDAYDAAVGEQRPAPDRAALRRLAGAGRIFRCLVYLDWTTSRPCADAAEREIDRIERCGSWLGPLLRKQPWLG